MPPKKKILPKPQLEKENQNIDLSNSLSFNGSEDDYTFSASYYEKAVLLKPQDIKQKLMIAWNITKECKHVTKVATNHEALIKNDISIKRINEFTGVPSGELQLIANLEANPDKSFRNALKNIAIIPKPIQCLLANKIRKLFVEYVTVQKQLPSKQDFLKELKYLSEKYMDEDICIAQLVRNKLLNYHQIPKHNLYLLTEHPERVYQRTLYLNTVKDYRLKKKNFVYIEMTRAAVPLVLGFGVGIVASPANGKLDKFFTSACEELFGAKWLKVRILPLLPKNCVVVLKQEHIQQHLSPLSAKIHFKAFLDQHGITYPEDAHKSELYDLYIKNKTKVKLAAMYDSIFMDAGIPVINLPEEWQTLSFFSSVWSEVNLNNSVHQRDEVLKLKIHTAIEKMSNLRDIEKQLIEEEAKLSNEDREMEDIIDNVQEMVKQDKVQREDFSVECSGNKTDYFTTHVSNYVVNDQLNVLN